jgi:DNA-binding IclR family transcriptional regulator
MNSNLGVLYKGDILHLAFSIWISGEPNYSVIGRRTPAHCTAMGKVILSSLKVSEVHDIINHYGWRSRTKWTITNFTALDSELQKIRQQGYAIDNRESAEDSYCLAFPILDQKGCVVAAMSATSNSEQFTNEFQRIMRCVKKNAEEVSYHMGYYGQYPVIINM